MQTCAPNHPRGKRGELLVYRGLLGVIAHPYLWPALCVAPWPLDAAAPVARLHGGSVGGVKPISVCVSVCLCVCVRVCVCLCVCVCAGFGVGCDGSEMQLECGGVLTLSGRMGEDLLEQDCPTIFGEGAPWSSDHSWRIALPRVWAAGPLPLYNHTHLIQSVFSYWGRLHRLPPPTHPIHPFMQLLLRKPMNAN